jgi:ribosomal protein S18 acetylase RimI-like enzyme
MIKFVQTQYWLTYDKVIIVGEHASVQLQFFKKKQKEWGGNVWLYSLYTDEEYRRQGCAKEVMAKAEEIVRQYGYKEIFLEWDKRCTPLEIFAWYERLGYDEIEFGINTSLMKKALK